MQKLEEILDRKLPLSPEQPKYLVNTKNKLVEKPVIKQRRGGLMVTPFSV